MVVIALLFVAAPLVALAFVLRAKSQGDQVMKTRIKTALISLFLAGWLCQMALILITVPTAFGLPVIELVVAAIGFAVWYALNKRDNRKS